MKNAIVRTPASNFADGLTSAGLGLPVYRDVLHQHARYCEALAECGLVLTNLDADERYADSTFVEDTAVITSQTAVLTRPGAPSRLGEVAAIRNTVKQFFPSAQEIAAPGTVDGGDICEAANHFFIGLSHRTNEAGAQQLAEYLAAAGHTASMVDIRGMSTILHLKSGISYIGEKTLVVIEEFRDNPLFQGYRLIRVAPEESYAANCVRVNERVLVAAGFPRLTADLIRSGFNPLILDVSEFRKMDGGLSCLSLRF